MSTQEPKTSRIAITVSEAMLRDIGRIPDRRPACRRRFVLDALKAYLASPSRPDLDLAQPEPKLTKAISEGTDKIKTGRYEP